MLRPDRQWLWILFIPVAAVWLVVYAVVRLLIMGIRLVVRPAKPAE
jgi:hypothetical protein